MPGLRHLGGNHVDHFFVAGALDGGAVEVLEAAPLSDHAPVRVAIRASTAP
jgi:endonuclease/exonuclease/phosphatase family metal-dependent hydrolase